MMVPKYDKHIFICINERDENNPKGDCTRCGGKDIRMKFVKLINQHGLKGLVLSIVPRRSHTSVRLIALLAL
ncbi:MAG: hypothetical protein ABGX30_06480, partial [bacterium]